MPTHALIPRPWREALNALAEQQGTFPTLLLTVAVPRLLARAEAGFIPDAPPAPRGTLVALVSRIPPEQVTALHALAGRTRIRYSEWLRQAVVDILREHGAMPEAEAALEIVKRPIPPGTNGRCGCGLRLMPGEVAPCVDCWEAA